MNYLLIYGDKSKLKIVYANLEFRCYVRITASYGLSKMLQ
jgi:predicted transporter